jgi:chemotaxis protein MotB
MSEAGHEGEENSERWLVTYADMITLLLAFFIMMYSMSIINQGKFDKLVHSMRVQLGIESTSAPLASSPGSSPSAGAGILAGDIANLLQASLGPELWDNLQVISGSNSVTIRVLTNDLFFQPGSATIGTPLRRTLRVIAKTLRSLSCNVRIEGHTCDLVTEYNYPSNWELSAQRAANVLTHFTHYEQMPAERFGATGFAGTRPVVPNTSDKARRLNRRVDIVLLDVSEQRRKTPSPVPEPPAEPPAEPPTPALPPVRFVPQVDIVSPALSDPAKGDAQ